MLALIIRMRIIDSVEQANINGEMKMKHVGTVKLFFNYCGMVLTKDLFRDNKFISRSKYQPHQNSRECARRVSQMATAL
jgi:hypothetical protein